MKKALVSLLTLALIGSTAILATSSFFSDQETSSGNTFQAGALDLKVNDLDNPGILVDVPDLKPGDDYFFEKRLRVIDNPAYVWVMLSDLVDAQGVQTEPEIEEENGIAKSDLQSVLIYDLSIQDQVILDSNDETSVTRASGCWIPLGVLPGDQEVTVTQSFHLPDTVTNWAQGDTLTFTERFYAIQERNNPNAQPPSAPFVWDTQAKQCISISITPTPTPTLTPTPAVAPFIVSDGTWKSSQIEETDWFLSGFDDSSWTSSVAPSYGTCNFSPINTFINENGALPMWVNDPVEWGTAYFRKHFYIPFGYSGIVRAVFDDTGDVYINGVLALSDNINNGNDLTSGDVSSYLRSGDNVVALRVSDTAGICQDIQFELALEPTGEMIIHSEDFEDDVGFIIGGGHALYWGTAPLEGTVTVPSRFFQGGGQAGRIFFGSLGKGPSGDPAPTMTINLPDLSGYTNLRLIVSLAAADTSLTSWEITHRDSLRISGTSGEIDNFLPISSISNLQSQVYSIDLHYEFQDFEYPINSSLDFVTFTFASTAGDEVVGIDSVMIVGSL